MVDNSEKKGKKGFLKDKGYHPENDRIKSEKTTTPIKKSTKGLKSNEHTKLSKLIPGPESGKPPRPKLESDKEVDSQIKKKAKDKDHVKEKTQPEIIRLRRKGYVIVVIGFILIIFSLYFSYQNYSNLSSQDDSIEVRGYELMHDLREYSRLKPNHDQGTYIWDAKKVSNLTSEDIKADITNKVGFRIQVEDISHFPTKFNRTVENDLCWKSEEYNDNIIFDPDPEFKIHSYINIYVSAEEVHLAKLTVEVWEI